MNNRETSPIIHSKSPTSIHVNIYKDARGMVESLYSEEDLGLLSNINDLQILSDSIDRLEDPVLGVAAEKLVKNLNNMGLGWNLKSLKNPKESTWNVVKSNQIIFPQMQMASSDQMNQQSLLSKYSNRLQGSNLKVDLSRMSQTKSPKLKGIKQRERSPEVTSSLDKSVRTSVDQTAAQNHIQTMIERSLFNNENVFKVHPRLKELGSSKHPAVQQILRKARDEQNLKAGGRKQITSSELKDIIDTPLPEEDQNLRQSKLSEDFVGVLSPHSNQTFEPIAEKNLLTKPSLLLSPFNKRSPPPSTVKKKQQQFSQNQLSLAGQLGLKKQVSQIESPGLPPLKHISHDVYSHHLQQRQDDNSPLDSYTNDEKNYMTGLLKDILQQRQSHQQQASIQSNVPVSLEGKSSKKPKANRRNRNEKSRLVNSETINHISKKQPLLGPASMQQKLKSIFETQGENSPSNESPDVTPYQARKEIQYQTSKLLET